MENRKIILIPRKTKQKTRHLSPKEKFEHFSNIRVQKLRDCIRQVSNLSNKRYYSYTEDQKKTILKVLRSDFNEMLRKWDRPLRALANLKKKKGFWDSIKENNE